MFSYYLNACAGAFARDIQLWQVVFSRVLNTAARRQKYPPQAGIFFFRLHP
jgi:hypothetical protein